MRSRPRRRRGDLRRVVEAALAAAARQDVQLALDGVGPQRTAAWARGVLERIRTQGGIAHDWLRKFAGPTTGTASGVAARGTRGMPAFPKRRPAPSFPTSARHSERSTRHRTRALVRHLDGPRPGRPGGRRAPLRPRAARRPRRRRRADHAARRRRQRRVADPAEARAAHPHRRHALRPALRGVRDAVPRAGDRDRRARRCALPSRPLRRQVRGRAARPRLLPRPVPGRPGAADRRPGTHVAAARGRTGGLENAFKGEPPAGAQRPRPAPRRWSWASTSATCRWSR